MTIVNENYSKIVDALPRVYTESKELIRFTKRPKDIIKLENRARNKRAKKSKQINRKK